MEGADTTRFLPNNPRVQFTSASSWAWCLRCDRTSSFCSWWPWGGGGRSTCGRSSCRSCTSEPKSWGKAQWLHHGDEGPSEGWTLQSKTVLWTANKTFIASFRSIVDTYLDLGKEFKSSFGKMYWTRLNVSEAFDIFYQILSRSRSPLSKWLKGWWNYFNIAVLQKGQSH